MKIVVLAGGLSPERNVSLTSGSLVAAALRRRGHHVLMLDVYEGLENLPTDPSVLFTDSQDVSFTVSREVPDLPALIEKNNGRQEPIGPYVLKLCGMSDVTFLALHGATGENGQLQAALDLAGIRYTGSGYIGSLLAMDKDIAKKLLRAEGILTPDWVRIDTRHPAALSDILEKVGLPAVVKPCSCGSSVGVSLVDTEEELANAIFHAGRFEYAIMVERRILGRELTSGILDGQVLPPVEIIPKDGFYDYENKYQAGATTEICPAPIDKEIEEEIAKATLRGFDVLRLEGYARFDYILDEDNKPWCLEANTLPGMTPTSLLPQETAAVGIDYDTLCETLVKLALKK